MVGHTSSKPRATPGGSAPSRAIFRQSVTAVLPMSGLLVLSSLDMLLARHFLPEDLSGGYAIGAVFEKVAFWGPTFLATLYYPRMARAADRARAIRDALLLTASVGAVGVLVAFLLGGPLVAVVGGAEYAALAPLAWLFCTLGVTLALVQVLVYADLAAGRHRAGAAVWLAFGAASTAVVAGRHDSIEQVVTGVLGCLLVTLRWSAPGLQSDTSSGSRCSTRLIHAAAVRPGTSTSEKRDTEVLRMSTHPVIVGMPSSALTRNWLKCPCAHQPDHRIGATVPFQHPSRSLGGPGRPRPRPAPPDHSTSRASPASSGRTSRE
jgi:hypothetical protein